MEHESDAMITCRQFSHSQKYICFLIISAMFQNVDIFDEQTPVIIESQDTCPVASFMFTLAIPAIHQSRRRERGINT